MAVELRTCAGPVDFPAIGDFLYGLYQPDNRDGNWLQPIWEYAHTHPWFDEESVSRIRLKSIAEENDLAKIDRVPWRGSNHPGEPPADSVEGRKKMLSGPHFRQDLTLAVEAPNGAFVTFAGLWFDPMNEFGYLEPVATDPDYRRMGLDTATVLEGIRRCSESGATATYVGSDRPFYRAMGFQKLYTSNCWIKRFSD